MVQLKVLQECVSLIVFVLVAHFLFGGQTFHWNHLLAFALLVGAVYLVWM